jgi:hypothetical protein
MGIGNGKKDIGFFLKKFKDFPFKRKMKIRKLRN